MKRRRGAVKFVVVALLLSLLNPITFSTPASAANNFTSLGITVDGVGRVGGEIKLTAYSKVPVGTTSVPDQIYVYLRDEYNPLSFATTQAPLKIEGNVAIYDLSFAAPPLPGSYLYTLCVTTNTTPQTYSGARSIIWWTNTVDIQCTSNSIQVGGAPAKAYFSSRSLSANSLSDQLQATANSQLSIYDSNGFQTLLTGDEQVVIASSSASVSSSYGVSSDTSTGDIPASYKSLTFNKNSGDSDGRYRFVLSDFADKNSSVVALLSSNSLTSTFQDPLASMNFSTVAFNLTGQAVQVSQANYSLAVASGSDGKAYFWGYLNSHSTLFSKSSNKPVKLDFMPSLNSKNNLKVVKIINGTTVLASDGHLYALAEDSGLPFLSNQQVMTGSLQPIESATISGIDIADATKDLTYLLDTQGKVWKLQGRYNLPLVYSLVDLTSIGSPSIQQIKKPTNYDSLIMLDADGTVFSMGDNTSGILGQGTNLSTGSLAQVSILGNPIINNIFAGESSIGAVSSSNEVWVWGNNSQGNLGKDSTIIPSSNKPILSIMPAGKSAKFWVEDRANLSFVAADGISFVRATSAGWNIINISNSIYLANEKVESVYPSSNYSWIEGYYVLSNGQIINNYGYQTGNCLSTYGPIRSAGQFGPVSTDDAVRYAGIYYSDTDKTVASSKSVSASVGKAFTLQVAQPRTNCFDLGELTFKWDLVGNGNYTTLVDPVLGVTGYSTVDAHLNYSTPGRKKVSLQINSPDSVSYYIDFVIGVDPNVFPDVQFPSNSTEQVTGLTDSVLAIGQDQNLYVWGSNNYGQLGISTAIAPYVRMPLKVVLPGGVLPRKTFSTTNATFVVDMTGKTWASGYGYQIDGTGNRDSFTPVTFLADKKIEDIQISQQGYALQKNGQILMWNLGWGTSYTPNSAVAFAGISVKQFLVQSQRLVALDVEGNIWAAPITELGLGDAVKISAIVGAEKLAWNGTQVVITTSDNQVWFSINASTPFAPISTPAGVTVVDAMFNGVMYVQDSTNQIWSANASQSNSDVIMSTWVKYASQVNGQANQLDIPYFQHRGSSFISFSSGNLLYLNDYYSAAAGRCNFESTSYSGNRVFSTGAFGAPNVEDQITANSYIAIAAQNQTSFSQGQFFATNAGDTVVIRVTNPRSNCFPSAQQFEAWADLNGTGEYSTRVALSNEGGSVYAFTYSAVAPQTGIKTISLKVTSPIGITTYFNVGLGVYSNTVIPEIVPRTTPINSSEAAVFAIGSDGYAYGWSTPTDVSYNYLGSTISFMNMITKSPPRNPGTPTKLELPNNPKIREAIPFTACCTYGKERYMFGALVVDENGKTYTWGSDPNLSVANGFASGKTPLTPTQIPELVGVDVMRVSVSPSGNRAIALSSNGVVYEWHLSDNSGTSYTQPTKVSSLAGLKIVDIFANDSIYMALTSDGDVYTFNGTIAYLGRTISNYEWGYSLTSGKVAIGEKVKALLPVADNNIAMVLTDSNKIYAWGQFYNRTIGSNIRIQTPTQIEIPGNRTAANAGSINFDGYSSNVLVASDNTWWDLTGNAQNQVVLYQRPGTPSNVSSSLKNFARGSGQAVQLQNGSIWTTNRAIAGTCGPISAFTQVMSDGQFGPSYKSDQVFINVSGSDITRPNTPTTVTLTGWSACDGGSGITFTADTENSGVYSKPIVGQTSVDGSIATADFTFTKAQNGPLYLNFMATSKSGLSGTTTLYTKVVPAPLPGRQVGISINEGSRYTNSSNVNLSLVWPDGTTKIYVSNDGGFAPGTVSAYDLQYSIPWVLPPQAVIPLPSIVYARFDNDPNTYYFDDIILDSIAPVLTYVSSK